MSRFSTESMTMWFGCAFVSQSITFWSHAASTRMPAKTLTSSTCLNPCSLHYEKMRPLSTNNSLQWFDRSLYHSRALCYHSIVLSFILRATRNSEQWKICFVNNNRGAQRTVVEGDSNSQTVSTRFHGPLPKEKSEFIQSPENVIVVFND